MSGFRKPYSIEEEREILNYIIRNDAFHKLRGYNFWKTLVKDELPHRSYLSLHERFRKYIFKNINNPAYGLSIEERKKFENIYTETAGPKKSKEKNKTLPVVDNISREYESTYYESRSRINSNAAILARDFSQMSDSDSDDTIPRRRQPRSNKNNTDVQEPPHYRPNEELVENVKPEEDEDSDCSEIFHFVEQ